MDLHVVTVGGTSYDLHADENWTFAQLKAAIADLCSVQPHDQQLLLGSQELRESTTVIGVLLSNGACLTVVSREPERQLWLEKLSQSVDAVLGLYEAPEYIRGNREVILAAIQLGQAADRVIARNIDWEFALGDDDEESDAYRGCTLICASEELRDDGDIVMVVVIASGGYALRWASERLRNDAMFILKCMGALFADDEHEDIDHLFMCVPQHLLADRSFALQAVQLDASTLPYMTDMARDHEFIFEALRTARHRGGAGSVIRYLDRSLLNDREFLLKAVQNGGSRALEFLLDFRECKQLSADREVVLTAVQQDGCALSVADITLQADKAVVLAAVTQSGAALLYAAEEWRACKEVVMAAVMQDAQALRCALLQVEEQIEVFQIAKVWHPDANFDILSMALAKAVFKHFVGDLISRSSLRSVLLNVCNLPESAVDSILGAGPGDEMEIVRCEEFLTWLFQGDEEEE